MRRRVAISRRAWLRAREAPPIRGPGRPMKKRPLVVVTRRLPGVVETRMRELFDTRLNDDDKPLSQGDLVEAVRTADVLVPTVTDEIDAAVLAQAGPEPEADREFRQRRRQHRRAGGAGARHHRHQHARRPHRGHGRHDDGADPRRRPAHGRGRAGHPGGRVGRLVADLDARPPHHRQEARHRRHGPHRPGAGAPRQGLRPVDPLPQPPPRAAGDRGGGRGDLLGEPRPDARPHGHRLGQHPAHAGDLPPALGPPPQADEAGGDRRQHGARRDHRRDARSRA